MSKEYEIDGDRDDLSYVDDDGNDVSIEIPMKWEICSDCSGDGKHMTDSMRSHAYTLDEFYDCFPDDEDQHNYFNGGYDVTCGECSGSGKVRVPDMDAFRLENKDLADAVEKHLEILDRIDYEIDQEYAAERRMGC